MHLSSTMSCLDFGGQGYASKAHCAPMSSIFQDIECIEAKADISETAMAIYTVLADVALEGVDVLHDLQSINYAWMMLDGLI